MLLPSDTAVAVPVNLMPLIDDGDFKTIEDAVAYNAAGLVLEWNFVSAAGVTSQTAVTPTDTGGDYDWVNNGSGMYEIEIPASGGASINNDAEGFGWFTGVATGILPFRGPVIQFSPANVANALVAGSDRLQTDMHEVKGVDADTAVASEADVADAVLSEVVGDHAAVAGSLAEYLEAIVEIVGDLPLVIDKGTAQSATSTTLQLRAAAAFADDELNGAYVVITGGTGAGQIRQITDYVSSTDTATVAPAWATTPSGTITYQVLPNIGMTATVMGRQLATGASGQVSTLGNESITNGAFADGAISEPKIASGALTASKFAAGAIDAAVLATDAVAEIVAGVEGSSGLPVSGASVRTAVGLAGATLDSNFSAIANAIAGVAPDVLNSFLLDQGTAQSATATTLVLQAGVTFEDDVLIGAFVRITGGNTGIGQCIPITDYDSATKTASVAFDITPTGTITYEIWPDVVSLVDAVTIANEVINTPPPEEWFANYPDVVFSDPSDWGDAKASIAAAEAAAVAAQTRAELALPAIAPGEATGLPLTEDVSAIALSNLTAEKIAPGRTFRVAWEGNRSDNIITLNTRASGTITLSADFDGSNKSNGLNPGTTIATLDSVTVTNQADDSTVTTSDLRVQQTLTAVNFDVAAIAAAGRFTVLIEVTTSDSQTLSMVGELVVEAP